ncbi:MAG TPA: primosomal protein N' [Clostridiales bacterium]|nr:primosomal protein N' [Clostridiales bacterium]
MIAEIIVDVQNSQVDKVFDYNIPSSFDFLKIGYRVVVPFGNRKIEGYIIGIKNSTDCPPDKLKSIISVCDEYPLILPEIVELIKFMKDKLYLRLIDGIRLAIPSQVKKSDYKFVSFVTLNDENLEDYLKTLNKRNQNIPKIIECLRQNGKVEVGFLNSKYGNANVKKLINSGILSIQKNKINRLKISDKSQNKVELTSLQKTCVKDILKSTDKPIVLYGVTGSGKTEVYMNVIDKVLSQGKTALMLVPEISLTPQMVRVFSDRFGTSIAVLHSALSVGEKHDEWLRIYSNDAKIVIGARSAIFAPLSNIGVIIIDEEHDSSYLSDSNPRYFTQDIAVFRAKYNKCPLVLGSATPSIETFYKTQTHEYNLTQMPVRVNQKPMPKIEIVDMCNEFRHGNNTILSLRLLEKLDETIKNNNQAILFINRRGFSSYLMCRECSYIPKCTECDANLVYHKDENVLKCHYCGKKFKVLTKCPQCGSNSIKLGATGTQQIVELIHEHFPKVSVFRLDNDSVKNKSSYSEILSKFGSTKPSILVGTQMVTKGHDFPKVTLVGIVDADISLFNYSYKANETTFQLVTQVSGRAGRCDQAGEVVLQTYVPKNPVYLTSANYDYKKFYDKEINLRETTKFPPFAKIVRVLLTSEDDNLVKNATHKLILKLKDLRVNYGDKFFFLEAMKSPVNKIKNKHRYQVVLRFNNSIESEVIQKIYDVLDNLKNNKLSVFVELNPNSLS